MAVNSNIIKALEEREWIRVVGHRDVPGKPALFGTTKVFLDYFGLKRLDELPPLSELKDIGELEPQLQFEPEAKESLPIGNLPTDESTADEGMDVESGVEVLAEPVDVEDDIAAEPVAVDETPDALDAEHDEDTASITETEDDDAETASSEQTHE